MRKLVLLRHGESQWNKLNLFTGWMDVDLTETGVQQAHRAGNTLYQKGYSFDLAFTSVLSRAKRTLDIALEEMHMQGIEIIKDWKMNERHYGALQGLNKAETTAKYGQEQVKLWRRSYDVRPPLLDPTSPMNPATDPLYAGISRELLPLGECLKDTVERVVPYWQNEIAPQITAGKRVIVCAHGNSLRGLIKFLDGISDQDIVGLEVPLGTPIVYELDDISLKPIRHYYLDESSPKSFTLG
jgi:2,3-bisphosphoglycerate-dependent phosphoglycerate mutase